MSTEKDEIVRTKTAVERTSILLAAIDAAGIPNDTALLDIREENGYLHVLCPADLRVLLDALDAAESERDAAKSANTAIWVAADRASRKGYELDPEDVLHALREADRG